MYTHTQLNKLLDTTLNETYDHQAAIITWAWIYR